jgi:molybdopterin-guanine dinucleotide biosynthesis protein A
MPLILAYLHVMLRDDICAVILAGGKSSRMGFNKALLKVDGTPLIRILVNRVLPITNHILVSSNDTADYQFLDFPVIPDQYREHGPLAGLHAAMLKHVAPLYLVLACDLPNLQTPFLRNLIAFAEGFDAAIPRSRVGIAHPLCAVYRRTCLPTIENALQQGNKKVITTFLDSSLLLGWIGPDEGQFEDDDLANINSPEDLQKLGIRPDAESGPSSICSS